MQSFFVVVIAASLVVKWFRSGRRGPGGYGLL
jgi:hypothetical protein